MKPPFLSNAVSSRGAQMGRRSYNERHYNGERLHLRRVPIDRGGYDPGGAYWGLGAPLWCAWCHIDDGNDTFEIYTRAPSRAAAKSYLESALPTSPRFFA